MPPLPMELLSYGFQLPVGSVYPSCVNRGNLNISSCSHVLDGILPPSSSSYSSRSVLQSGPVPPLATDRSVPLSNSFHTRGSVPASSLAFSSGPLPRHMPTLRPSFHAFLRTSAAFVLSARSQPPYGLDSVESDGLFGFDSCSCVSVRSDSANDDLLSMSPKLCHGLMRATGWGHSHAWSDPTSSSGARAMAASATLVGSSLLPSIFTFTFDSGSDTHLLILEAARALLSSQELSSLKVLGVSGVPQRADLQGNLILAVQSPHGTVYNLDCGRAHGMQSCPLNLLSVSLLLKKGCVIHFEDGACYFQPAKGGERLPFRVRDGLFELDARRSDLDAASSFSCSPAGRSFGAISGDLTLWHRRVRHMSRQQLLRISKSEAVEGFMMKGKHSLTCACDTCSMAKIRSQPIPHHSRFSDPVTFVGHTVSTDTKSLQFPSVRGYCYVICYVDRRSLLTLWALLFHAL